MKALETGGTLQATLADRLEREPEGRAMAWVQPGQDIHWLSFEEFCRRGAAHAAALSERGLGRGDVCVIVEVEPEFACCTLLGTLLLGAVPLLVAPPTIQGTQSVLNQVVRHVVQKTGAVLAVCATALAKQRDDLAEGSGARWVFGPGELAAQANADVRIADTGPDDIPALQLTSGTTGFPRICVWRHAGVLAALGGMQKAMSLRDDDVCLNWTPLYHDMGLVNNFFLCMAAGIPLAMQSPLDFVRKPALWLRGLHEAGATITWSPNFGFALATQRIRDPAIEGVRLDRVRGFWNAAERIHAQTLYAFHERFRAIGVSLDALKTNFGCVENVGGATFSDPDGSFVVERVDARRLQEEQVAVAVPESDESTPSLEIVSAGRPHPDMLLHIVDSEGERLPDGHVGEVALETPSALSEILGDDEDTRATLRGRYVFTGDLGYVRGNEFFWTGRLREKINLRGRKFDPSDFERILLRIPDLREGCFAAFGVDDPEQGTQELVILSELRDPASRSYEAVSREIRAEVAQQLGVHVQVVMLLEKGSLTKTSSGKRRHRFFREQYLSNRLEPLHVSQGRSLRG